MNIHRFVDSDKWLGYLFEVLKWEKLEDHKERDLVKMYVETSIRGTGNVKIFVLHVDTREYPLQPSGQNYTAY